jgi:hypothetical protein
MKGDVFGRRDPRGTSVQSTLPPVLNEGDAVGCPDVDQARVRQKLVSASMKGDAIEQRDATGMPSLSPALTRPE